MRKNLLSLCAAAAVCGIAGNAVAMQAAPAGATNTRVVVNTNTHIGHNLVIPYYSAQGDNATLISLTNNDTVNGKAVKVRFRGAANSDDVLDFTVFLSPADVWTAAISKSAEGLAQIRTDDNSCTQPNIKGQNVAFSTLRVDSGVTAGTARNAQTLEGYVEFITMANIPQNHTAATTALAAIPGGAPAVAAVTTAPFANALFTTTKHVNGTAPCVQSVLDTLQRDPLNNAEANIMGLYVPTAGISANYVLLNTKNTTAWSGAATAFLGQDTTLAGNPPGDGNIVFWPQMGTNVADGLRGQIANWTADPLLIQGAAATFTGASTVQYPQWLDLPDLSTPITNVVDAVAGNATAQAIVMSQQIASTRIRNEFITNDGLAAETDWLMSMPTRRFATVMNYGSGVMVQNMSNIAYFNVATGVVAANKTGVNPTTAAAAMVAAGNLNLSSANDNAALGRRICVVNLALLGRDSVWDREEQTPAQASGAVVVSPAPANAVAGTTELCGEAALMSFNNPVANPSALLGTISRINQGVRLSSTGAEISDGWASFATPSAGAVAAGTPAGLPIIGSSFTRLVNGTVNYGISYPHRRATN